MDMTGSMYIEINKSEYKTQCVTSSTNIVREYRSNTSIYLLNITKIFLKND